MKPKIWPWENQNKFFKDYPGEECRWPVQFEFVPVEGLPWVPVGLLTLLDERTVRANSWLDPTPRTMDFVRLKFLKFVPRVDPNGAFIE